MSRPKSAHLRAAHYELESWASWIHTHQGENGIMGAQVSSYEGFVSTTPPHALVPRIDMPRSISIVDMAYNDLEGVHKKTIKHKYIDMIKVSRHAEDRMLEFVAGILFGAKHDSIRKTKDRKSAANRVYKKKEIYSIQVKK